MSESDTEFEPEYQTRDEEGMLEFYSTFDEALLASKQNLSIWKISWGEEINHEIEIIRIRTDKSKNVCWNSQSEKKLEFLSPEYKACIDKDQRFYVHQSCVTVVSNYATAEEIKKVYDENFQFLLPYDIECYKYFVETGSLPYELKEVLVSLDIIKAIYTCSELCLKYCKSVPPKLCNVIEDPDANFPKPCKKPVIPGTLFCSERHAEIHLQYEAWVKEHDEICKHDGYEGYGGGCCSKRYTRPETFIMNETIDFKHPGFQNYLKKLRTQKLIPEAASILHDENFEKIASSSISRTIKMLQNLNVDIESYKEQINIVAANTTYLEMQYPINWITTLEVED